jgi:hypothetical protein
MALTKGSIEMVDYGTYRKILVLSNTGFAFFSIHFTVKYGTGTHLGYIDIPLKHLSFGLFRVAPTPTPAARRPAGRTRSARRTGRVRWCAAAALATWGSPPPRPDAALSASTTVSARLRSLA